MLRTVASGASPPRSATSGRRRSQQAYQLVRRPGHVVVDDHHVELAGGVQLGLREGEPAVRDYLGFLSGGCSADPITLLRGAGVDMASPKPVEDATALFDSLIGEMEELLK